jgi:primosomal protein N' (replication factor Y)
MTELFVDLAIPGAGDKLFTYSVPNELIHTVKRGVRVVTSFGKRTVVGFVVETSVESQNCAERGHSIPHIKPIQDVLDIEPVLTEDLLNLTSWISDYYMAPLGEVLKAVLVQGAARPGKRMVSLTGTFPPTVRQDLPISPKQAAILRELSHQASLTIQQLKKNLGEKTIYAPLNELEKRGSIRITDEAPQIQLKSKTENIIEITAASRQRWEELLSESDAFTRRALGQAAILRSLVATVQVPSVISAVELLKQSGGTLPALKALVRKDIISLSVREVMRKTEFDLYSTALGSIEITLNDYQQSAFEHIRTAIDENRFQTFLLHGITGSGKTQIYIESIRETLARHRTAILLEPEISLTPQIVRRFKYHFGDQVVVLHSRMSIGERFDAWRAAWNGTCSIVIGPRSAIFAPLKNVGLIVVDEEHEPSYKQYDQTPRYHARDVAIIRASTANAVVILGSATPSLESYTNALNGKYTLLELPDRIETAELPRVEIVNMTEERKRKLEEFRHDVREQKILGGEASSIKKEFEPGSISAILHQKIEDRIRKKEGIILLQNRRGFASFIECPDCGYVEMCENCNISLTYHLSTKHLRCHYCGFVKQPAGVCPRCGSTAIRYQGVGTQRVEEELLKLFPGVRLVRMDLDTTTRRGSHDALLKKFSEGDADILLGTQMVAKGLDFSHVTLVGIISADTQMLLPDFRSSERTFQLLTQVAGRAGRSALAGEVVLQTNRPDHPTLQHVLTHDFRGFYHEEIESRKELDYPPFSRLILLEFRGKHEEDVMQHASEFGGLFQKHRGTIQMMGPASAALSKLKGMHRWHIILKSPKSEDPGGHLLHKTLQHVIHLYRTLPSSKSRSVKMIVDVDPVSMM